MKTRLLIPLLFLFATSLIAQVQYQKVIIVDGSGSPVAYDKVILVKSDGTNVTIATFGTGSNSVLTGSNIVAGSGMTITSTNNTLVFTSTAAGTTGTNVTLQGNTFNVQNALLKLDSGGQVPVANLQIGVSPSGILATSVVSAGANIGLTTTNGGLIISATSTAYTGASTASGDTLTVSGSTITLSGTRGVTGGGTGLSSFTINSFFYAGGTTTFSQGVFGSDHVLTNGTLTLTPTNTTITRLAAIGTITTSSTAGTITIGGTTSGITIDIPTAASVLTMSGGGQTIATFNRSDQGGITVPTVRPHFRNGLTFDASDRLDLVDNGDGTTARLRQDSAVLQSWTTGGSTVSGFLITNGSSQFGSIGTPVKFIRSGTATLSSGTVVVTDTNVTATSRIIVELDTIGTVTLPSAYGVTSRVSGSNFTIKASAPTDTSVVDWWMWQP